MIPNTGGFGERLRRARIDAGMTQSQLVAASGVPKPTISRYENNHVMPSVTTLARLAAALGVTESSLLGRTDAEDELLAALRKLGVRLQDHQQARRVAGVVARALSHERPQHAV